MLFKHIGWEIGNDSSRKGLKNDRYSIEVIEES